MKSFSRPQVYLTNRSLHKSTRPRIQRAAALAELVYVLSFYQFKCTLWTNKYEYKIGTVASVQIKKLRQTKLKLCFCTD